MKNHFLLDLSYLFARAVGPGGIAEADLETGAARLAFDAFEARRAKGEIGFVDLPRRRDLSAACREAAAEIRAEATDFLHVGIGGSALGPRALVRALTHPHANLLDAQRRGNPRIFFLENADPETLSGLRDVVDLSRTWIHVVSKSGGTVETLAQWLIVREWLVEAVGEKEARRRTVFTTDPDRGALREVARAEGIRALDIPPNVGGRYSALTPVGLLPLAVAGIDPDSVLNGAQDVMQMCTSPKIDENPALQLACALHALDVHHGKHIHVLMAYADALADTAEWFRQLWAESLGKRYDREGREVFCGPTPVKAVGAIDQHSQLQLYLEGPPDKVILLLGTRARKHALAIPRDTAGRGEMAYLGGHGLGELLDVEQRATEEALARSARPCASLELDAVTPESLGALYQLLELATGYAGELYGVNAFDQPAVEVGKRIAYHALGRPGYASESSPPPPRDARRRFPR